ncbi:indirect negative regulator of sigma-B activity [Virgibacillus profundi]|uniref:Indirect negative regulator of sigma-B activity n=1 Tax=Virgibacillus profundi TaxID=2024555 RepID=A0A2A2IG27_9BACI|nr:SpoIIE family protein phosphatase [Virgibacillus profundi]PAV30719.1 indirect negative regulator of sigma-B activity [Virgibacillus profundi]PXY54891.1 indirect negative regulator of sigma-B activity [Virgibacillus profundi]
MSTQKKVDVSAFQKAKKGNYYCGDSYFYTETENEFVCAIADGLGSGEYAMESSRIVIDIIKSNIYTTVEQLVKKCNEKLFGKRGVVLGILKLDFKSHMYSFSSIGNIGVMRVTKDRKKKRNIPNAGYLAGYHRPFKVVQEKLEPETNFIMFSDGVSDRELSQGFLMNNDVDTIIKTYENTSDNLREDDTTLIVMRYKE